MHGRSVDGKEVFPSGEELPEREYRKLKDLENKMTEAAKNYHEAKVRQKKGGFEKHKTAQGRDRDEMSMTIANFSVDARSEENAAGNDKIKVTSLKDFDSDLKNLNKQSRKHLDAKVKKHMDAAKKQDHGKTNHNMMH